MQPPRETEARALAPEAQQLQQRTSLTPHGGQAVRWGRAVPCSLPRAPDLRDAVERLLISRVWRRRDHDVVGRRYSSGSPSRSLSQRQPHRLSSTDSRKRMGASTRFNQAQSRRNLKWVLLRELLAWRLAAVCVSPPAFALASTYALMLLAFRSCSVADDGVESPSWLELTAPETGGGCGGGAVRSHLSFACAYRPPGAPPPTRNVLGT